MWANWIKEQQLKFNISFYQIESWFCLTAINKIGVSQTNKFMESIFYNISINHRLISTLYFMNLIFHFALKDSIKLADLLIFIIFISVIFMIFQNFS